MFSFCHVLIEKGDNAETFVMPLAHTRWKQQAYYTFCAVRIVSGKTHQIRHWNQLYDRFSYKFLGANWAWWIILVFLLTCSLKREHGRFFWGTFVAELRLVALDVMCWISLDCRKAFGIFGSPVGCRPHLQSQRLQGPSVVPPAVSW